MANLIPVDHDPFDMSGMLAQAGGLRDVSAPDQLLAPPRNQARMPQAVEDFAKGMTIDPLLDAAKALRGQMTPDEQQNFAMMAGLGLLSPMARGVAKPVTGIRAYHGSPHDFERFDISKIGTGEGAQSYGHGLYFAENPAVAADYRDTLAGRMVNFKSKAEELAKSAFDYAKGNPEAARVKLAETIPIMDGTTSKRPQNYVPNFSTDDYRGALALVEKGWLPPKGKMYEVNINAKPEQFLDWDKPLAKQPQALQQSVSPFISAPSHIAESAHPRDLLKFDTPEAIAQLREAGIPGIKYLDAGSRRMGDAEVRAEIAASQSDLARLQKSGHDPIGVRTAEDRIAALNEQLTRQQTSNYVLFDDKIVTILRKYGIAGLSMLPPAVAASIQSRLIPVDHDPFEGN